MRRLRATELRDGLPVGPPVEGPPGSAGAEDAAGLSPGASSSGAAGHAAGIIGSRTPPDHAGHRTVEVVVDGWRFEFRVEDADRADLRARATRDGGSAAGASGPLEIRAIIPGRVAAVAVTEGDQVTAGQALLIVEAMKMQNELKAPRDGVVARVAASAGATIEIGDLLVVLG